MLESEYNYTVFTPSLQTLQKSMICILYFGARNPGQQ